MHESWTLPTANMTYTRSQNYTNMVVGKHGIPTFSCARYVVAFVVVVWYFCPRKCTFLIIYGQVVCPNKLRCQYLHCSRNPHDRMTIPMWAHKHRIESLAIYISPYCGHFQLHWQFRPLYRMCNCLIFVSNRDLCKLAFQILKIGVEMQKL